MYKIWSAVYYSLALLVLVVYRIDNWNASGCSTHEFENGSVLCSCDHLTHFAIILSPGVDVRKNCIRINNFWILNTVITRTHFCVDNNWTSSCAIFFVLLATHCSIHCIDEVMSSPNLYLADICSCHSTHRALWNMRNYIHVMLCANMFVAQLLFVIGVGQTNNEVCESNYYFAVFLSLCSVCVLSVCCGAPLHVPCCVHVDADGGCGHVFSTC